MERQTIVGEHNDEEDQVHAQVQHVCQQLQVKHVHSLQVRAYTCQTKHSTRKLEFAVSVCSANVYSCMQSWGVLEGRAYLVLPSSIHVTVKS